MMERRLLLAVVLMIVVAIVPSLLLKPAPRRGVPPAGRDSAARVDSAIRERGVVPAVAAGASVSAAPSRAPAGTAPVVVFDTVSLTTARAALRFTTAGGALEGAVFPSYRSFTSGGPVNLVRPGDRLLVNRLVVGADTIRLDSLPMIASRHQGSVTMTGSAGALTVTLDYAAATGHEFLYDVTGHVAGLEGRGGLLLVGLGTGFAQHEGDSSDNYRQYGIAVRRTSPESHMFRSVDTGQVQAVSGPFDWVALKSKYFLGAVLSADSARPQLGGAILVGMPRTGRNTATHTGTWVTMPVGLDGRFRYQFYLGPQENRNLHPLGRQLDRASPYGWIFRPIVMPVATWITRLMVWMHERLHLTYGLVLVLFGVMVRVLLWPLNQKAMKSQVAMMAVQPLLKDIQDRYKQQPDKQQAELLKVYKEHKVNPFGGCLPLLLPWPVLLALFFVFANTIEFRGVPFLWLPDLAQKDPFYVIPLLMGGSMWALSKLAMAGMPPNPQTKMMTVVMPIMMTVMFANFASGLNLYYAVSNLVSLPQQWFINKSRQAEMAKRQVAAPVPAPARR